MNAQSGCNWNQKPQGRTAFATIHFCGLCCGNLMDSCYGNRTSIRFKVCTQSRQSFHGRCNILGETDMFNHRCSLCQSSTNQHAVCHAFGGWNGNRSTQSAWFYLNIHACSSIHAANAEIVAVRISALPGVSQTIYRSWLPARFLSTPQNGSKSEIGTGTEVGK